MALVDYAVHVRTRFDCPHPQDAAPARKGRCVLLATHLHRDPHCMVEAHLGTFGSFADRTDVNFYQGHVPDAPVLLGAEQSAAYSRGLAETAASKRRILATLGAACIGAALGLAFTAACIAAIAVGHAAVPGIVAGVNVHRAFVASGVLAGLGAIAVGAFEHREWGQLRRQLKALLSMSTEAARLGPRAPGPAQRKAVTEAVKTGLGGNSWALQQAALELEGHLEAADAGPGDKPT